MEIISNLLKNNVNVFFKDYYLNFFRLFFFLIISIINIIYDLKRKKVFSILLIISSCLSLSFLLFYDCRIFINCFAGCIVIIIVFLLIFFISKEGIGLGDMFYLAFFSSLYGYFFSFISFLLSFWIAALVLIIPYLIKKIDKKTKIPFVPFLFMGCVFSIIIGFVLS